MLNEQILCAFLIDYVLVVMKDKLGWNDGISSFHQIRMEFQKSQCYNLKMVNRYIMKQISLLCTFEFHIDLASCRIFAAM